MGGFTENSRRGGFPGEGGGGGAGGVYGEFGGGGGPRPLLPRKRAPFSAKTPFNQIPTLSKARDTFNFFETRYESNFVCPTKVLS